MHKTSFQQNLYYALVIILRHTEVIQLKKNVFDLIQAKKKNNNKSNFHSTEDLKPLQLRSPILKSRQIVSLYQNMTVQYQYFWTT